MKKIHQIARAKMVVFIALFVIASCAYGQNKKPDVKIDVKKELDENGNVKSYDSTYSFSWSGDGSVDLDSFFQGMDFGFSPFFEDEFFGSKKSINPGHSENPDSLNGFINPNDSVYYFNSPDLNFPFLSPFGNSFDKFFDDPFFHDDFFNPQSMMEKHMRMMEEFRKNFGLSIPDFNEVPDTVTNNKNQKFYSPSKPEPKGIEI